jgi:hypothetical protein
MSAEDVGFEIIEEIDREFHDSTDQVIAMVGAAYLDAPLDKLLRAVFIEKADDVQRLLRTDGPIGSTALIRGFKFDERVYIS